MGFPLVWLTLETMPSSVVHSLSPLIMTSTIELPNGKAVRTSPSVISPESIVARTPPAFMSAKVGLLDLGRDATMALFKEQESVFIVIIEMTGRV
jgi:hypothetical protein